MGAGLFNSCRVKGTKETAKVKESCQKAGFDFSPQVMTSCLRQLGSCNVMKISASQYNGGRAAAWHLTFCCIPRPLRVWVWDPGGDCSCSSSSVHKSLI